MLSYRDVQCPATGAIARLVCARLRESGVQIAPLLSKAGLTVEQIDDRSGATAEMMVAPEG